MPIQIEEALKADMPAASGGWEKDQVILYHLGVGAGVPALDPNELEYTYEKNLKVLPSFAVIGGARTVGSVNAIPGLDVNLAMLLHGEQDTEVMGPIPVEATTTSKSRITDIFDKGKAALVLMETTTSDSTGNPLFINRSSLFIRGEGGWGGESGPPPANQAPDREPDKVVESVTIPQQAILYRLNGDKNPLHIDPDFSKLGGFDVPILHGLCTHGIVCKAVVDNMLGGDTAAVARYQVRFAGVVYPGETIVTKMWTEGKKILIEASVKERGTPALSNAAMTTR